MNYNHDMEGLSVAEIARTIGITARAAKARLERRGIEPKAYIGGGPTALYDASAVDLIKESPGPGRPKKKK
jgi:hypothetical protein